MSPSWRLWLRKPLPLSRRRFFVFATAVCSVICFITYIIHSERLADAFPFGSIKNYSIHLFYKYQLRPNGSPEYQPSGVISLTQMSSLPQTLTTDPLSIFQKYAIFTERCKIPDYDWRDPVILKRYFQSPISMCPRDAKPFFFFSMLNITGDTACIGVDEALLYNVHGLSIHALNCTYKGVERDTGYKIIDAHVKFGRIKTLRLPSCPMEEYIWIECVSRLKNINMSYEQPLLLPKVKPARKPLIPNYLGKKPLHVLVAGLDSLSRLNAYRQLPKTMKFLHQKENLIELYGYNKIGANSAPNQIPFLTGKKYTPAPGLQSMVKSDYFDNMTRFLWDKFADMGYRTMFYEEEPNGGLFVYHSPGGFSVVPTDYWPRPMVMSIDTSELKTNGGGRWCIGPDFPAKYYLQYTYQTMKLLGPDRPMWSYSWISDTAHENVNGGIRVDEYFHKFFVDMDNDGILNNTAVFFMSDHGFRKSGEYIQTNMGRYEDRLPSGFILMPDQYFNAVPNALKNLRANSRRLVTVYDLHATMLELSDMWSEGRTIRTSNGYSLLSNVIPRDRNCEEAGIKLQFCACLKLQAEDKNGPVAATIAKIVLGNLNDIVKRNGATAKCFEWNLARIADLFRLKDNGVLINTYLISVKTMPEATFEVTASITPDNDTWKLVGPIDRIDYFYPHTKCVRGTQYERYCNCR